MEIVRWIDLPQMSIYDSICMCHLMFGVYYIKVGIGFTRLPHTMPNIANDVFWDKIANFDWT